MEVGARERSQAPWLLPGILLVGGALATAYVLADAVAQRGIITLSSLLAMIAVGVGVRINRIADNRPWLLSLVGLGLLTVLNASYAARDGFGAPGVPLVILGLLQTAGYLALLSAAVLVVLRHAPQDKGGVIDAALIGIGLAAPLWELLLRPRLQSADEPTSSQAVLLAQILALLGILGALLRISRTTARGRGSLRYLFGALTFTLGTLTITALASDLSAVDPRIGWIGGYLSFGAAALHPSSRDFTVPGVWRPDRLSPARFRLLGLCLLLNPVVGGIPLLFGQAPDVLLLCVGPLLSVPLVLLRIRQLIDQHNEDQRRLAHQASHDELTGLPNRRHVFERLEAELRAGERPVAVLFCDLNNFKPVNDRLGHDAGDAVLRTVAARLRQCLRPGELVGRIGGDEFLMICPGAGTAEATAARERIERALAAPMRWGDEPIAIASAVGFAIATPGADLTAGALVAAADQAMYRDKRSTRQQERSTGSARRAAEPPEPAPVPPLSTAG